MYLVKGYAMTDICPAINNLQLISFSYHGYSRVVEPHTYGVNTKGHRALRAYQVRGESRTGRVPDWRYFRRDEMYDETVLQETFEGPRPGYKRGDKAFETIFCQL